MSREILSDCDRPPDPTFGWIENRRGLGRDGRALVQRERAPFRAKLDSNPEWIDVRGAAVALEQPPEAHMALDFADALLRTIGIVTSAEMGDRPALSGFAEEEHPVEAIGID
jgi:hypothetical protein